MQHDAGFHPFNSVGKFHLHLPLMRKSPCLDEGVVGPHVSGETPKQSDTTWTERGGRVSPPKKNPKIWITKGVATMDAADGFYWPQEREDCFNLTLLEKMDFSTSTSSSEIGVVKSSNSENINDNEYLMC